MVAKAVKCLLFFCLMSSTRMVFPLFNLLSCMGESGTLSSVCWCYGSCCSCLYVFGFKYAFVKLCQMNFCSFINPPKNKNTSFPEAADKITRLRGSRNHYKTGFTRRHLLPHLYRRWSGWTRKYGFSVSINRSTYLKGYSCAVILPL